MFNIAVTPSASYFAPGSVMTSIFFIDDAGILFNTSLGLLLTIFDGFPLI